MMTTRQTVKRFLEPALHFPGATARAIIWHICVNLQSPINAFFIALVGSTLETQGSIETILISYIILLSIIHIILEYIHTWGRPETYFTQMRYIHNTYLPYYLQLDNNYVDTLGTGKIIAIVYQGFEKRTQLIVDGLGALTNIVIILISGIYFTSQIGIQFVILYVVLICMICIIAIYIDIPSRRLRSRRRDSLNEYSRSLVRFIMSKNDIIQNNKIDYEIIYTGNHIDQAHMYTMQQSKYLGRMHNIPRTIVSIFRIVIVIIGGTLYLQNNISLGYVLALLSFVLLIDKAVIDFVKSYKDFTKDLNIVQRLWQMIDDTPRQKDYNIGSSFIYKSGNIHIHNLNFSYGSNNVFSDFDLQIQGGTKTAFVGESGGGKTTLIKLLAGYIRPDSGDIEIDGQKLSEVKLIDYYKHIGYLTQDPSVFDGTIYENLVYALDTEPAKEELEKVVNLAKCEFIREFEKGLETEIGERGVRLSGGQKQRLAIAKIMLKNPNIILLDEPTSALDSFNEELINIALHNLFKGKTVIVVAHRLQTVKQADRILMIEHGNIIEQGTHDQLVKLNGKYKKMLDLQSGF